jgi:hypothetical protein
VNRSFLIREWGAVTFVVTVFLGIVIVPIALVAGNHPPPPSSIATPAPASPARTVSPAVSPTPTP